MLSNAKIGLNKLPLSKDVGTDGWGLEWRIVLLKTQPLFLNQPDCKRHSQLATIRSIAEEHGVLMPLKISHFIKNDGPTKKRWCFRSEQ